MNTHLRTLGYSDNEIVIYTAIVQHGKMTPLGIARLTRINRTTVYTVLKQLVKKGLVFEEHGASILSYGARPVEIIEEILQRQKRTLDAQIDVAHKAVGDLRAMSLQSKYSVPKIIFVEEEDIEKHLYRQTKIWNKSMLELGVQYWGFQDSSFVRLFEEWIDWYWTQEPSSKSIVLKILSEKGAEKIKKQKYTRRQIRFWDKTHEFTASTWVMGDYVVMIQTTLHPYHLVEIHDSVVAHNLRAVFKGIWEEIA